jgi:hypothetical protein
MVQNPTQGAGYDAGLTTYAEILVDHKGACLLLSGYGAHDADFCTDGIMTLLTHNREIFIGATAICFHDPDSGEVQVTLILMGQRADHLT